MYFYGVVLQYKTQVFMEVASLEKHATDRRDLRSVGDKM
jgi:hypothetical protein